MFTDIVISEFIARATRVSGPLNSLAAVQAAAQLENWLSSLSAKVIQNSPKNFNTFSRLCKFSGVTGKRIFHVHIVEICIDSGLTELSALLTT